MCESSEIRSWSDGPFRYVGGDPSLDLINTVDWTGRGLENDRLTDYERLVSWALGVGTLSLEHGDALTAAGAASPRSAAVALEVARSLRSALQRVLAALARTGQLPDDELFGELNAHLASAFARLRIAPDPDTGRVACWDWRGQGEVLESMLWPVARSAAVLLTSEDAHRIRICAGDGCGWMFVDRSRNRLRRWCEMGTCGTRAKSRRRAERGRAAGANRSASDSVDVPTKILTGQGGAR